MNKEKRKPDHGNRSYSPTFHKKLDAEEERS